MNVFGFIGVASLTLGFLMFWFRHPASRVFCGLGKIVFCVFRGIKPVNDLVHFVYDERKGPTRFAILGTVFVVQGIFALALAAALKG